MKDNDIPSDLCCMREDISEVCEIAVIELQDVVIVACGFKIGDDILAENGEDGIGELECIGPVSAGQYIVPDSTLDEVIAASTMNRSAATPSHVTSHIHRGGREAMNCRAR